MDPQYSPLQECIFQCHGYAVLLTAHHDADPSWESVWNKQRYTIIAVIIKKSHNKNTAVNEAIWTVYVLCWL